MSASKKVKTRKPSRTDSERIAAMLKGVRWLKVGEAALGTVDKDGVTHWERVKFKMRRVSPGRKPPKRKAS